ncbi:universal stress protein [Marinomonas sp. THO17]|uniref:universal stress protein n=1 Tax=Marinomonas sp. THO17 TaxID=3149048 RepID=UPI00336BE445
MLPKLNTLLYACDLETHTQSAIELVFSLALTHQAKVIFMHVMEPLNPQAATMIHNYINDDVLESMRKEAKEQVQNRLDDALQGFLTQYQDSVKQLTYAPETLIVSGSPADSIQQIAKQHQADLIIMNSRTHSTLGQMLLGSTANKVIHSSDIPVLVVPIK